MKSRLTFFLLAVFALNAASLSQAQQAGGVVPQGNSSNSQAKPALPAEVPAATAPTILNTDSAGSSDAGASADAPQNSPSPRSRGRSNKKKHHRVKQAGTTRRERVAEAERPTPNSVSSSHAKRSETTSQATEASTKPASLPSNTEQTGAITAADSPRAPLQNGAAPGVNSGHARQFGATMAQQAPTASSSSPAAPPTTAATGMAGSMSPRAASKHAETALSQTKQDIPGTTGTSNQDHTLESPLSAVGDSWKMIAYLLPTLLFIVVSLNLLRRYQQRKGQLPGFVQAASRAGGKVSPVSSRLGGIWGALLGSFPFNKTRETKDSSIRLLESLPIGSANLHLVQVNGRLLLLGATGTDVRVLTEFREQEGIGSDDFRSLLHAAAADMDSLDLSDREMPDAAVVSSLEDVMRETGDALQRRARRLRTVQEAEDAVD